nr:reverse transcriptase domain-containing protein [Tanacetum cinerariifolium]
MAKMFLVKYFPPSMVTKLRHEITNFRQRPDESLCKAWEHYKLSINRCPNHNMSPVTQIDTFYNGLTLRHRDTINAAAGGTFMKRRPEECYDLIENMNAHHNDWDTSVQRSESSSFVYSSFDPKIVALKAEMAKINKNLIKVLQINQQVKEVTHNSYQAPAYKAPGYQAPVHQAPILQPQVVTTTEFINYMKANDAILKNMQTNMTSLTNSNLELKNMFGQFMKMNTASSSGSGTLPSNTITNPKEDLKGITTQSGNAYKGPTIPTTSSLPKVVERETEVTKDTVPPTNKGSTKDVQPSVVQIETQIPNSKPVVEPVVAPVSALKPNPKPSIPYPSRLHEQKLRDKTNDQKEKFSKSLKIWISTLASRMLSFSCLRELTLRVGKEAEVLGFFVSGNPTPSTKPIISNSSPTFTPFGDNDFLLEETDAFLAIDDEPILLEIDESYCDSEGDILLLEEFLNDDPSSPLLPPQELKFVKPTNKKYSIDEPPVVELKDLPPHLEYAFLEGDDKLPIIIAKDLKDEEKTTLIKVLKSHKQALTWQLFNIKGLTKILPSTITFELSSSTSCELIGICVAREDEFVGVRVVSAIDVDAVDV